MCCIQDFCTIGIARNTHTDPVSWYNTYNGIARNTLDRIIEFCRLESPFYHSIFIFYLSDLLCLFLFFYAALNI